MGLFGKKKECVCKESDRPQKSTTSSQNEMIKILGGGCQKCHALEENTRAALKEMGLDIEVALVTDFSQIAAYGVMTTPAIVYHEKVLCYGKVLSKEEIAILLKKEISYAL